MRESKFYQEILEEGRGEGRQEMARANILEVLEVRFGTKAPAGFREALHGITGREQLSELLRLSVRCRRLTEFRRALSSVNPTTQRIVS
jgi:predicted transposase YdaD